MEYFETEVPCPYTTFKDLSDRLHGTICKYGNVPYHIRVESETEISLWSVDQRKLLKVIPVEEVDDIDVQSIELGYMNYEASGQSNVVLYGRRTVKRQWKQGLSYNNTLFETLDGQKKHSEVLNTVSFENSVLGIFPTFSEALTLIGKEGEYAISQEVAVKALPVGVILMYVRGKNLGWIAPKDDKINLQDNSMRWVAERSLSKYNLKVA